MGWSLSFERAVTSAGRSDYVVGNSKPRLQEEVSIADVGRIFIIFDLKVRFSA